MDYLDIMATPSEATAIFNHLVDQKSIEAVVVCKDQAEAKTITTFVDSVPRNMNCVITTDFFRFIPPTKKTSYRSYYIDPTRNTMLRANMGSRVKEKEEDLMKVKTAISDINVKSVMLKRTEAEIRTKLNEIKDKIAGMWQELQKTSSEKIQLHAEEDSMDNFEALKSQLNKKEAELDVLEDDLDKTVNERDEIANQINEKNKLFDEKSKEISELRASGNPIEIEISKIDGLLSSKKKEITIMEKVVEGYETILENCKKELKDKEREGEDYRNIAEEKTGGKNLNPTQTVCQLNAKIKQLRESKTKQETQETQTQKDVVLEEFKKKKSQYEMQRVKVDTLEGMVKEMEGMNERRRINYLFIRKKISNIIAQRFALESETFSSQVRRWGWK